MFDENYNVVKESATVIPDIKDDDGDTSEDLIGITRWLNDCMESLKAKSSVLRAINISAHGASLVHLDKNGNVATPFYDYMKPLEKSVTKEFYQLFGGEKQFSLKTGSPVLNMLNSGIQLFWLKRNKPALFKKINKSLHLPQYANFILTGKYHADITSIGCHTGMWDFQKQQYHSWLSEEEVLRFLPPPESSKTFDQTVFCGNKIPIGIGLHDSSAALLPFIYTAKEPFALLSTGTWNIMLNPFFNDELKPEDYDRDCLYFLFDINRNVAASRLFLGNEYQYQMKRLTAFYHKDENYHNAVTADKELFLKCLESQSKETYFYPQTMKGTGPFPHLEPKETSLSKFPTFEEAYHKLMLDLTYLQKISIELICGHIKNLYVTGGFTRNIFFMELLQSFLPEWNIFTAENPRASALGAALAIHDSWQVEPIPEGVSPVKRFRAQIKMDLKSYKCFLN